MWKWTLVDLSSEIIVVKVNFSSQCEVERYISVAYGCIPIIFGYKRRGVEEEYYYYVLNSILVSRMQFKG